LKVEKIEWWKQVLAKMNGCKNDWMQECKGARLQVNAQWRMTSAIVS